MNLNNQKGFSLVELLIAIVIIGILAAVAVPQYNVYVAKSKESEAVSVMGAIKKAQNDFRNMQKSTIADAGSRKWRTAYDKLGYNVTDGTGLSDSWNFNLSAEDDGWTVAKVTAALKTGVATADGRCTAYTLFYCAKEATPFCTAVQGSTPDPDLNYNDSPDATASNCGTEDGE